MKEFEYHKLAYNDLIKLGRSEPPDEASEMEALDSLGSNGWELVEIKNKDYDFKREKKPSK